MTLVPGPQQFAMEVVGKLRAAGHTALFAGGCVRDLLLERPSNDYDVATTAKPDEVRQIFGHKRTLAVGASFGVIIVLAPNHSGHVEVATFRTEGDYTDGRRPQSVAFCTPEEDAKRRDFTINGMFYDPFEKRVLDFVGGEADLREKLIRAIGDPRERVREDKLRMLRAVRFTATLNFVLDAATAQAIREMSSQLRVVSSERITQELKKMLVDQHRRRAMDLAQEVLLLNVIFPELENLQRQSAAWDQTLRRLQLLQQPSFELALASLLKSLPATPVVSTICRRMKLSNDETERIVWLVAHQHDLQDAPGLNLAALKRCLSHRFSLDLIDLMQADLAAAGASLQPVEFCRKFLAETPEDLINPVPLLTGDDLIAMGYHAGPRFKLMIERIRDAQLNLILHTREQAMAMVRDEWDR